MSYDELKQSLGIASPVIEEPEPEEVERRRNAYHWQKKAQKNFATKRRAENQPGPGEIRLKEFLMGEMKRLKINRHQAYYRWSAGMYSHIPHRVVNERVTFVSPPNSAPNGAEKTK